MRRALAALAVVACGSGIAGQASDSAASSTASFEVASIKRNRSPATSFRFGAEPGGRWSMVNGSVITLIRSAYPLMNDLIGVPNWADTERYDVTAKAAGDAKPQEMIVMLRTLLTERFKLTWHAENRDTPIFALVVADRNGRPRPALAPSHLDCEAIRLAREAGRALDATPPANGAPPCGWSTSGEEFQFGGVSMSMVASTIRAAAGRVVVDRTGLTGRYEFTLRYSPDQRPGDDVPSLFTALQDQLGLKLVADRASLPVLVIDHIERPSED